MRAHDGDLELIDTGNKAPHFVLFYLYPTDLLETGLGRQARLRGNTFLRSALPSFSRRSKVLGRTIALSKGSILKTSVAIPCSVAMRVK